MSFVPYGRSILFGVCSVYTLFCEKGYYVPRNDVYVYTRSNNNVISKPARAADEGVVVRAVSHVFFSRYNHSGSLLYGERLKTAPRETAGYNIIYTRSMYNTRAHNTRGVQL